MCLEMNHLEEIRQEPAEGHISSRFFSSGLVHVVQGVFSWFCPKAALLFLRL